MSQLNIEEVREIINAIPNSAAIYPEVEGYTFRIHFAVEGTNYEFNASLDSGRVTLYDIDEHETVYEAGGCR